MDNNIAGKRNDSALLIGALVLCNIAALQGGYVAPLWIGLAMDHFKIGAGAAGFLISAQLGAVALASLLTASRITTIDRRRYSQVGLIVSILGNAVSLIFILLNQFSELFMARMLTGLGEGVLVACVNAMAGNTIRARRTFTTLNVAFAIFAASFFICVPGLSAHYGTRAIFIVMIVVSSISFLFTLYLPSGGVRLTPLNAKSHADYGNRRNRLVLLGHGFATACSVGIWAFVERVGHDRLNLNLEQVGVFLSFAATLSFSGALFAHAISVRKGYAFAIKAGLITYILVAFVIGTVEHVWVYAGILITSSFTGIFYVTTAMSLFSHMDPSGRTIATAPAYFHIGAAVGPALVGISIQFLGGYIGLSLLAALFSVGALLLLIPAARQTDESQI